jgi:hypothetical protein
MPETEANRVGILEKRLYPLLLGCADLRFGQIASSPCYLACALGRSRAFSNLMNSLRSSRPRSLSSGSRI